MDGEEAHVSTRNPEKRTTKIACLSRCLLLPTMRRPSGHHEETTSSYSTKQQESTRRICGTTRCKKNSTMRTWCSTLKYYEYRIITTVRSRKTNVVCKIVTNDWVLLREILNSRFALDTGTTLDSLCHSKQTENETLILTMWKHDHVFVSEEDLDSDMRSKMLILSVSNQILLPIHFRCRFKIDEDFSHRPCSCVSWMQKTK